MSISKYSIVIVPPKEGVEDVAKLKDKLNARISWYHSRNAKAHLTITEFTVDEDELVDVIDRLKEITSYESSIHLGFEGVGNYSNGAVYLKPNVTTKTLLTELMIRVQKKMNIKNSYHSKDPHISIGRKLSEENVEIALQMFAEVKLDFDCSNLVLRRFNPDKKQYEIFSEDFDLLGLEPKPNPQQSLF